MTGPRTTTRRSTRPHRWSFPVVRVHGVEVRVHVSFLVLVALFAVAAPEPGVEGALLSVAWLVAVFGCVVVHELGHSLVAISRGAEVDEILLFPLGGVSRLRHLPESPRDELAIAAVGPLTSFGLAALAAIAGVIAGRDLLPVDLVAGPWLARLAWLNLILGAFNLLPAFPLDGGRILRALLERRHDVVDATRIATHIGHVLAGTLIVLGLFVDVWLTLIGVFVWFGGSAEEAATVAHARLRGHRVREIMEPVVDVAATEPVVDSTILWTKKCSTQSCPRPATKSRSDMTATWWARWISTMWRDCCAPSRKSTMADERADRYVVSFEDVTLTDAPRAGGKGANLGELTAAELPVPPGFVVLADSYLDAMAACDARERLDALVVDTDPDDVADLRARAATGRDLVRAAGMPATVCHAVLDAYHRLGSDVRVAVRSSATGEDSSGTSFAGMHETFTNVHGDDAVIRRIVDCWVSLFGDRVVAYRADQGIRDEPAIAVVVQQMVDAERSGVMFGANPSTGDRSEVVIEAAFGLGEVVVGGLVEPDTYVAAKQPVRTLSARIGHKAFAVRRGSDGVERRVVLPDHHLGRGRDPRGRVGRG